MNTSRRPGRAALWLLIAVALGVQLNGKGLLGAGLWFPELGVLGTMLLGVTEMFRERRWGEVLNGGIKLVLGIGLIVVFRSSAWLFVAGGVCFCLDGLLTLVTSWNRKLRDDDDEHMNSIVLLFDEPRYLDAAILCRLASEAWAVDVHPAPDDEDDDSPGPPGGPESGIAPEDQTAILYGHETPYLCLHWPATLMIHNVDQPYFDDVEEIAAGIADPRIADAVRSHQAWIAVDLLKWFGDDQEAGRKNADRLIGQLLAELVDDSCVAVLDVMLGAVYPYDPETEEKLRSGTPHESLAEMYYAPMVSVDPDDEDLKQAVATARSRWPEFVAAFEQRTEDDHFSVKARFEEDENVEFIWLTVTAIEGDAIFGELGNEPHAIQRIQLGDKVRVTLSDLNDWIYLSGDDHSGGFTIEVLAKKQQEFLERAADNMASDDDDDVERDDDRHDDDDSDELIDRPFR
jgi:uncharacterized protein YegJ (DUF2314 family)